MDLYLAIFIRFLFALLVFLPFLSFKRLTRERIILTTLIGFIQVGIMYICYFESFKYLTVIEVALFTVVTPLYVSMLGNFIEKKVNLFQFVNVLLVLLGSGIIKWGSISSNFFLGFLLIQGANISFALGQVLYKRFIKDDDQKTTFSFFYIGALIPLSFLVFKYSRIELSSISMLQWGVLIWLGVIASGLGYYLWNSGAKKVGYQTLAVMNNLVIPMAILVNLLVWNTDVNWSTFLVGSSILITGTFLQCRNH